MPASIVYRQTVTLPAAAFHVDVTMNYGFTDTNYVIALEFAYETWFWISNKTSTGFRINVGTNHMYDQPIGILIQHN